MKTEQRLKELGIELATPTSPMANYVNAVRTGNLLYLAGKGPGLPGKPLPVGKVGRDFSVEQGYGYARETGLSLIAVMKAELGDLDRVKRIVKVLGMVNATSGIRQPARSDQRLLRSLRRGVRRSRPPRALGRRHGLAAARHPGRDRGDRRDRGRAGRPCRSRQAGGQAEGCAQAKRAAKTKASARRSAL